ncbi:hypothetical protein V1478_010341 [Vespula squamosa]|uniref:Uncharacterized protein n=1 Tax=Vespula squamosa TaxID=30214 RepID=A0ABD2AHS4_VESSQ
MITLYSFFILDNKGKCKFLLINSQPLNLIAVYVTSCSICSCIILIYNLLNYHFVTIFILFTFCKSIEIRIISVVVILHKLIPEIKEIKVD